MENITKEKIINDIKQALNPENNIDGRNSMGVSENYYNTDYLIGKAFKMEELENMNLETLLNLYTLAEFASEAFY